MRSKHNRPIHKPASPVETGHDKADEYLHSAFATNRTNKQTTSSNARGMKHIATNIVAWHALKNRILTRRDANKTLRGVPYCGLISDSWCSYAMKNAIELAPYNPVHNEDHPSMLSRAGTEESCMHNACVVNMLGCR